MEECPEYFYKYRSLDGDALNFLERIICHKELWFPAPRTFNDPFDCYPIFDLNATVEEKIAAYGRVIGRHNPEWAEEECIDRASCLIANPANLEPSLAELQRLFEERIMNHIGVLSLSANPNSTLMWAHYANSHKGVCLQFNGFSPFFAAAQKVSYPPKRRRISLFRDKHSESMETALLSKCEDWRYEEEWRIINHEDGPGAYRFPNDALTGIIFGARIEPSHEASIRNWAMEGNHQLQFFRAKPSTDTFEIHIEHTD